MSDDRELVERLAAIEATPRASWVAELRADLDAAWETGDAGYLDSLRTATLTLVDHEPAPSGPSRGRRWPILIAAAAAIVVAIALVATRDDATPADQPSPTVTVTPTTPPRPLPHDGEQLVPGTYFVDEVSGTPTPRIFATVGVGWRAVGSPDEASSIDKADIGYVDLSHPVAVYSDACHWENGYHPSPVHTVDGLVAALSEQQGWAEVTAPSDISVDGYVGKAFQRTALADMSNCSTRTYRTRTSNGVGAYPDIRSWDTADGMGAGYYEPGLIETLWILDIDGTVVVIRTGAWPEPSAGASPDFAADVLDSIRIERT